MVTAEERAAVIPDVFLRRGKKGNSSQGGKQPEKTMKGNQKGGAADQHSCGHDSTEAGFNQHSKRNYQREAIEACLKKCTAS